jgi:SAM-dependent methyltransferase
MIEIAFANDCDSLTWENYLHVHGILDRLQLPAGDSFWLFSPENSDMALFTDSTACKTANHDNLLGQIREGRVDVLHGIGAFGKTPTYPDREEIQRAFDYLDKQNCAIKIWSNHGNKNHVHNIAAQGVRTYQQGDLPYSEHFVLDIAQSYGIEFFWLSHNLRFSLNAPFRILRDELTPSGASITTFTRFAPDWTTNAWTVQEMITRESLERAIATKQNVIYFTHWGTRGKDADESQPLFRRASLAALALLADMQACGEIRVVRLVDLLQKERHRSLNDEIERISLWQLQTEHCDLDNYYKIQFEPAKISYFSDLTSGLGIRGKAMLDAGGGAGNLSFPATTHFETVVCLDTSTKALEAGAAIANGLQLDSVLFQQGSLEDPKFPAQTFDAICARGVLHLVDHDIVLREFHSIMRPGGTAFITVNGDGFYQHAICDKNMNIAQYSRLLWNTLHRRIGGDVNLISLLDSNAVQTAALHGGEDELLDIILDIGDVRCAEVMRKYQPELKMHVGTYIASHLMLLASRKGFVLNEMQRERAAKAMQPEQKRWTCHYPEEFADEAHKTGFKLFTWRQQSAFSTAQAPYLEPDTHHGLLKMWYAFLVR